MEQKEFNIESLPNNKFRIAKLDPTEILALGMTTNFEDFKKTVETMNFSLEHVEVQTGDKWTLVKQPGRSVYMPMGIETNYKALREIIEFFIEEVLSKVF